MAGMAGRARWLLPALLTVITGCGTTTTPPGAGQAATINLSLNTVPIVRSVTISATQTTFNNCRYGDPHQNTGSQPGLLGYPNGVCWIGVLNPFGSFPIKITNMGIASDMEISGASAIPVKPGGTDNQWSLCNYGSHRAVACTGPHGRPGTDQYVVENFGPSGRVNVTGLTGTPVCDHEFASSGSCLALEGAFQKEGIELTGPWMSTDTSTKWTVPITWTPVPGPG